MIKTILVAGFVSVLSCSTIAGNVDSRQQWLFNLTEFLSYHVMLDHLRENQCRAHFPETSKYGVASALTRIQGYFPTQKGENNFDDVANFFLNSHSSSRIFDEGRKLIGISIKEMLDTGESLERTCSKAINHNRNLIDNSWPTIHSATNKMLQENPDGFGIENY